MRYTELNGTGIKVSRICLGGMSFGDPAPEFHQWTLGYEDTKKMISYALEAGINFIDTANAYSKGSSERFIGRVHELSERYGVPMSQIALAWHFSKGVTAPIVGGSKLSHLRDAIEAVDVSLSPDDVAYLEEPYRPHEVVGALPE